MNNEALYELAREAGLKAGEAVIPRAMVVVGFGREYYEPEGMCGFAWIHLPDARVPFAKLMKAKDLGFRPGRGGYDIWVRDFNQSMQRKEAYARAFAEVLKANGIAAYAQSRLD